MNREQHDVQRTVRPHGCSEALGRVACPKFMGMKKADAERTSSFASGCDLAGQLSGSYPNSRSSCEQRQALAIFAAHWTAASRDGSSRTQKPPSNSLVRRWPGGVELGGRHQRALGALILLLAPYAGQDRERLNQRLVSAHRSSGSPTSTSSLGLASCEQQTRRCALSGTWRSQSCPVGRS